jgi:twinkle protein
MMGKPIEEHIACPQEGCDSSDAYCTYLEDDGNVVGYCFSCDRGHKVSGSADYVPSKPKEPKKKRPILFGKIMSVPERNLSIDTCKKYDIGTAVVEGNKYYTFGYTKVGEQVRSMSKVRGPNKCFNPKEDHRVGTTGPNAGVPMLFGQQSFKPNPNKSITITEGEFDAPSYYEMSGGFPAVSVRSSGQAVKDIEGNYEWLNGWKEVVICFDSDKAGKEAAQKIAVKFPGKCRIMRMTKHKDANEYHMKGHKADFLSEWYEAQVFKLDGLITGIDAIMNLAKEKPQKGIDTIWNQLTYIMRGFRLGEVITIGGGTGLGKSETLKEILFGIMKMHKLKVGTIMLEENSARTVQCFIGKELNKRYYLEDVPFPEEAELLAAAETLAPYMTIADKCSSDWEDVKAKIEYMVNALGIKYIAVDHLTAIAEGKQQDVNSGLHMVLEDLAFMAMSLGCTFFCVSHLNQSANKNHEEGARVTLRDFYGSGAIKQRSNFVFGFEGDLHGKEIPKNIRIFRCLKDRNAGDRGGCFAQLEYDADTGRLNEFEPEEDENLFEPEDEEEEAA